MIAFIKSLFGVDAVVNTATKIIDKIAGTDFTPKEKAQFLLDYQNATKHQSPARRFIAVSFSLLWVLIISVMVVAYIAGNVLSSPEVLMIAKDMKMVIKDLMLEPMNLIVVFYFSLGAINGIKK